MPKAKKKVTVEDPVTGKTLVVKKSRRKAKRKAPTAIGGLEIPDHELQQSFDGDAPLPLDPENLSVRMIECRKMAGVDYATNPEHMSVRRVYDREDRPYSRICEFKTFQKWAHLDKWTQKREQFWNRVEGIMLQERAERVALKRMEEIENLEEVKSYYEEYLAPQRDKDGNVKRYKSGDFEGLPMFALELPSWDRFVKSYIDLDKHLMTKRGEVTERTEKIQRTGEAPPLDPVANAVKFSPEDLRAMAAQLVRQRQPQLIEAEGSEVKDDAVQGSSAEGDERRLPESSGGSE